MITLEPITFIARKGPEMEKYGDKYDSVCTLVKIDDDTLMIKGLVGGIVKSEFAELLEKIKQYGFTKLTWERKK